MEEDGLIKSIDYTAGNVHDATCFTGLPEDNGLSVYANSAYLSLGQNRTRFEGCTWPTILNAVCRYSRQLCLKKKIERKETSGLPNTGLLRMFLCVSVEKTDSLTAKVSTVHRAKVSKYEF